MVCIILFFVGVAGIFVFMTGLFDAEIVIITLGIFMVVGGFAGALVIDEMNDYKYEQHKAIITDFDEMHEQGYEIVEQEGEIFTIQLKGAEEQ